MPVYYYTKDQLLKVFQAWSVSEPIPGKGKKTVIAFPPSEDNQFRQATVTVDPLKSTYGKSLYKVVMEGGYADEARDIVAVLTESGLRTRRERASFVARLKEQMGLTFVEIGKQLNVSRQRAQQLYVLNRLLQRQALGHVSYDGD